VGVVVDASLLAAIALTEPQSKTVSEALQRWSDSGDELHAPALLPFEVGSALTKAVSRGEIATEDAGEAWLGLQHLPITFHDMHAEVPEMIETASALRRRSAYHAAYLVLAKRLGAEFFTLDGSLYRNAAELGHAVNLIE
jgi:predicted nucleic acid-binding protein